MSRTTIYRCDLCGDESTKAGGWALQTDVGAYWGRRDSQRLFMASRDLCPGCLKRIETSFREAWDRVKDGRQPS